MTHNHPIGSNNEYSFCKLDITTFTKYQLEVLRGIDEKFVYELNRNSLDLEIRKKKTNEEWRKAIDWVIDEEDRVY